MAELALKKERIDWIDIAKGIGIILVVLGHLNVDGQINRLFIYCFHMPLFFFISGIVFNIKGVEFKEFLIKRIKSLYLPYVVFLSADYFINFGITVVKKGLSLSQIKDFIVCFVENITGLNVPPIGYAMNTPIWFLCALFFSEIFFYFIIKIPKKILLFIFPIGIIGSHFIRFSMPFCISYLFPTSVFFVAGYIIKSKLNEVNELFSSESKRKKIYIFTVILFIILLFTFRFNGMVSVQKLEYGSILLFYFNAFTGSILTMFISMIIKFNKLLIYFGKNSIIILCFHFYFTRHLFPYIIYYIGLGDFLYNPIVEILLTVITMAIMVPIIYLSNKYLFFIFGKTRRKSGEKGGDADHSSIGGSSTEA